MCGGACLRACLLSFLLSLGLACYWGLAGGLVYYYDFIKHQVQGVDFHLHRDPAGTGWSRHADKKVLLRHDDVASRLRSLPDDLAADGDGARVRHLPALAENDINPAGYAGLSTWPQIALGAAPRPHRVMREFMNARVSAAAPASLWNAGQLRRSATAFLATQDRLDLAKKGRGSPCEWVDMELWRIVLDVDQPHAEATKLCGRYMMAFLTRYAIAPGWTARLPGDPLDYAGTKAAQRAYVDRFRASKAIAAAAGGNATARDLMAHVAHDAIALAGGLSSPGLIAKTLQALQNSSALAAKGVRVPAPLLLGDHSAPAALRDARTRRALVLEVARLLPEVTHVPVAYADEGPVLLSLEGALVDPATWGADAREVRLDRLARFAAARGGGAGADDAYKRSPYGMAWAHPANADGGHTARGCPGMGLSLALIEAFVGALVDEWERWIPTEDGAVLYRRGSAAAAAHEAATAREEEL